MISYHIERISFCYCWQGVQCRIISNLNDACTQKLNLLYYSTNMPEGLMPACWNREYSLVDCKDSVLCNESSPNCNFLFFFMYIFFVMWSNSSHVWKVLHFYSDFIIVQIILLFSHGWPHLLLCLRVDLSQAA